MKRGPGPYFSRQLRQIVRWRKWPRKVRKEKIGENRIAISLRLPAGRRTQKKQPPSPIPQLVKEEKEAAAEIEVEEEEDEEDAAVFRQGGTALRTHNLFFSPQNEAREFTSVLQEVQEYISSQYSTLIMDDDSEETREQIKRYITKYVQDNRIAVKGMDGQVLIDTMYTEMAGFSFLHKYVFGEGIEEIDSATRS